MCACSFAAAREYSPAENDCDVAPEQREITIDVPPGAQTVSLQNTGADWVTINRFTLSDYAPALAGYALSGRDFAAAWIYHRGNVLAQLGKESAPASGEMTLDGFASGRYRATWWDTCVGKALSAAVTVKTDGKVALQTPQITRDAALFMARDGAK